MQVLEDMMSNQYFTLFLKLQEEIYFENIRTASSTLLSLTIAGFKFVSHYSTHHCGLQISCCDYGFQGGHFQIAASSFLQHATSSIKYFQLFDYLSFQYPLLCQWPQCHIGHSWTCVRLRSKKMITFALQFWCTCPSNPQHSWKDSLPPPQVFPGQIESHEASSVRHSPKFCPTQVVHLKVKRTTNYGFTIVTGNWKTG